jgi:hypothetical protein
MFFPALGERSSSSTISWALVASKKYMSKIEQQNDLERKLHVRILNMMANNFDRWQPDADPESVSATVDAASLLAAGIAQKLSKAIAESSPPLTPPVWRKMVTDATRNAVIEIGGPGTMIDVGQNYSFVRVVEECTASVIAPPGSKWACRANKRQEQRLGKTLARFKLPPHVVEYVVKSWAEESQTL